jgi:hypothetical protein
MRTVSVLRTLTHHLRRQLSQGVMALTLNLALFGPV